MKNIYLIVAFLIGGFGLAQIPDGYYDSAEGLSGYTLKSKLSEILNDKHKDKGYDALWTAYATADIDKYYENDNTILDIYSENPSGKDPYSYRYRTNQCGNYSGEGSCYNREHIVPQSLFSKAAPMRNDAHFVIPTDGYVNGKRSDYPFGVVGNASWTSKNGSKLGKSSTSGYGGTVFEPIDEFKGDVARMVFYFVTMYEKRIPNFKLGDMLNGTTTQGLEDWQLAVLLTWHNQDPVSKREIDRNNAVYNYQGNRNPFIDHPEWVNLIWKKELSTQEVSKKDNILSIYPNPVTGGKLYFSNWNDYDKIDIFSTEGKKVKSVKSSNEIDVSNLPKGVYLLKADSKTIKFIIK
ncbi:endonuclease [Riemerella anatipestifer]|uniref:endonuclease n=1 Tax=Riemerella anatipestifer TaxID=34085 RepID=UPI0012ADB630|nr:endonuclease [Riemerella anatipestifer]USL95037.1 endonuclease [Riemerella anatipestifer]